MKTKCLNIQDCGYSKTLSSEEIIDLDLSNPFGVCPLCGYYTITSNDSLDFNMNLNIFKKLYKQIRKK